MKNVWNDSILPLKAKEILYKSCVPNKLLPRQMPKCLMTACIVDKS